MAISSTIDDKRRALLLRLDKEPEPDMEVFSHIKNMLNSIFGEANNQILRGLEESKRSQIRDRFRTMGDDVLNNYPQERIYRDYVGDQDFTIFIRFPEITIRNDAQESHQIRDLWIKIPLNSKGHIGSMLGARSSLTPEEYIAQYRHSHLPQTNNIGWEGFCLGEGPLSMMIPMMSHQYKPEQFQLFLLNIREYVSWESLSGTPYVRMNTIKNRTGSVNEDITTIPDHIRGAYIRSTFQFLKDIPFDFLKQNVDVKLDGARFVCSISPTLENMITLHFRDNTVMSRQVNLTEYLCYKNTDGKYVSGALADVVIPHQTKPLLKFKGEEIFLKLINKEENVQENTKYLHPVFKRELETRLSNYFNSTSSAYRRAEASPSGLDF